MYFTLEKAKDDCIIFEPYLFMREKSNQPYVLFILDPTSKEGAYIPATLEQFKEFELKYKGVLYTTEGIIEAAL